MYSRLIHVVNRFLPIAGIIIYLMLAFFPSCIYSHLIRVLFSKGVVQYTPIQIFLAIAPYVLIGSSIALLQPKFSIGKYGSLLIGSVLLLSLTVSIVSINLFLSETSLILSSRNIQVRSGTGWDTAEGGQFLGAWLGGCSTGFAVILIIYFIRAIHKRKT